MAIALVCSSMIARAGEEHAPQQHTAHVHGKATLNLVVEEHTLYLEFDSPAANITGYERAPSSTAESDGLDKAINTLKDGALLFRFDDDAKCRMVAAEVNSGLLDDASEHHHDTISDNHHPSSDHAAHDAHTNTHGGHANFTAFYQFTCAEPGRIAHMSVLIFDLFPAIEQIQLQYVNGSKQGIAGVTAGAPVVEF